MNPKIQIWLNKRRKMFLNEGQKLFELFKKEFNMDTSEARKLIHSWDADFRNIKSGHPKVK